MQPEAMAKTIAWEAWHRDKAERALKTMKNKQAQIDNAIGKASNRNKGSGMDNSEALAKIIQIFTANGGHQDTPHEKKKKARKFPSLARQKKNYDNFNKRMEKRTEGPWVPKPFEERKKP